MRCQHEMPFGARLRDGGGAVFRLWAPAAGKVELAIETAGPRPDLHPASADAQGWWECVVDEAAAGTLYRWRIDAARLAALHPRVSSMDLWPAVERPERPYTMHAVRGSRSRYVSDADAARLEAAGCPVDTLEGVGQLQTQLNRKLGDQRRQWAEQLLELRGLRGKSGGKVQVLLQRAQSEAKEFEQSTAMLGAIRSVHNRMLKDALLGLSGTQMREPVEAFFRSLQSSFLPLNARKSFVHMCSELRGYLDATQRRCDEIHTMLGASFAKLNAEFGFSLSLEPALSMRGAIDDLAAIERNYVQYFGLTQALRLAQQPYQVQFKRMLLSRLRVVFENAASTIELWNKSASALVDTQLRDRRRAFKRRHEALTRVQSATGELESRIQELEALDCFACGSQ